MSEGTHTPKYNVLYNRLTGGIPFAASTAIGRITALADALEITQDDSRADRPCAGARHDRSDRRGAAGGDRNAPVGAGRGADGAGGDDCNGDGGKLMCIN